MKSTSNICILHTRGPPNSGVNYLYICTLVGKEKGLLGVNTSLLTMVKEALGPGTGCVVPSYIFIQATKHRYSGLKSIARHHVVGLDYTLF